MAGGHSIFYVIKRGPVHVIFRFAWSPPQLKFATRTSLPYYWPDCLKTVTFHLICPMATMNCNVLRLLTAASLWVLKCCGLWPQQTMAVAMTGKIELYEHPIGQLCMLWSTLYEILWPLLKRNHSICDYIILFMQVLTILRIYGRKCRYDFCGNNDHTIL